MHASAKKESKYELAEDEAPDGRRDHDADWGAKGNGKKKRWWFGYLVHLIVDATYELRGVRGHPGLLRGATGGATAA